MENGQHVHHKRTTVVQTFARNDIYYSINNKILKDDCYFNYNKKISNRMIHFWNNMTHHHH